MAEQPKSNSGAGLTVWKTAVRAEVYFLARRLFRQQTRDNLKKKLATMRKRLTPVYLMVHGRYSARELVEQLDRHVPQNTEVVFVHSAYDRLLPMYTGNPRELITELIAFCDKRAITLVMPAFVLGGRLYDKREYFKTRSFDVKRTPSEMGLLTEVFRRTPGVLRSLHPTHSVCAIGPLAEELTTGHHLAPTRTGLGTPFEFMARKQTAIVGLGVEYYRCLTQTHTAEDILGDEFPVVFKKEPFSVTLVDVGGTKLRYELTIPESGKQLDNTRLRSILSRDELVEWTFKGTPMFVTMAGIVTQRLIDAARVGVTVYGSRTVRNAPEQRIQSELPA